MAENSAIEWTDHTFNPWVGCTKISPACDHCYAEGWAKRSGNPDLWQGDRRRTTASNWQQPIKWNRKAERESVRRKVFCASLADVFDNQVPERWRRDLWHLITHTPSLDWLLLTKRPQNIAKMLPDESIGAPAWGDGYPNVWLGTTVANQEESDRNIPHLLSVPARVHFLSIEPMLGPIDLGHVACSPDPHDDTEWKFDALANGSVCEYYDGQFWMSGDGPERDAAVDWVIAGGESGPGARPMSQRWVRDLRDQCVEAGTPFFFKQWGEWAPAHPVPSETPGKYAFGDYDHDPGLMVQTDHYPRQFTKLGARSTMKRVGKKAAGALLDGREWRQIPGEVSS